MPNDIEVKDALNKLIDAWESLPTGNYPIHVIDNWLHKDMAPAINYARGVLGRKPQGL